MEPTIGIDFGTSNCSAFAPSFLAGAAAIPLEGENPLLPSVIFTTRQEIAAKNVADQEFSKRLKEARKDEQSRVKGGGVAVPDEVIRTAVENLMIKEARQEAERQYWDQTFFTMLKGGNAALYGTPAMKAYLADPLSGTLMKSPKSFLGTPLRPEQVKAFENAVTSILLHIKQKSETYAKTEFSNVILGRPVNYRGVDASFANDQAIAVMTNAAKQAGFKDIQFCFEPIAAAMAYEKAQTTEKRVLVIDIGGGTTDCTVIKVGPALAGKEDRTPDVLSYAGERVGGADFDQAFAWTHFMPLFGKNVLSRNGLPLPSQTFFDAISTRDIPAQIRFNGSKYQIGLLKRESESPELIARLERLHSNQYQHRLVHSAELTKHALSVREVCTTPLRYAEDGLSLNCERSHLEESVWRCLMQVENACLEALKGAGITPDVVFVTGGMGFSPIVRNRIKSFLDPNTPIEYGDMLGSVGMGLGLQAAIRSGQRK